MDKELQQILETEAAKQLDQEIFEGFMEVEMMTVRESVASILVEHGVLSDESRQLAS